MNESRRQLDSLCVKQDSAYYEWRMTIGRFVQVDMAAMQGPRLQQDDGWLSTVFGLCFNCMVLRLATCGGQVLMKLLIICSFVQAERKGYAYHHNDDELSSKQEKC